MMRIPNDPNVTPFAYLNDDSAVYYVTPEQWENEPVHYEKLSCFLDKCLVKANTGNASARKILISVGLTRGQQKKMRKIPSLNTLIVPHGATK